jgi:hypothetical protein
MTSQAKIESNRRNALRSTGPRSTNGKARSRGNARKHGLAIPVSRDDSVVGELTTMAETFGQLLENAEAARLVAEAQLELIRVQRKRTDAINHTIDEVNRRNDTVSVEEWKALGPAAALEPIAAFDRYERRASSRLRKILKKKGSG